MIDCRTQQVEPALDGQLVPRLPRAAAIARRRQTEAADVVRVSLNSPDQIHQRVTRRLQCRIVHRTGARDAHAHAGPDRITLDGHTSHEQRVGIGRRECDVCEEEGVTPDGGCPCVAEILDGERDRPPARVRPTKQYRADPRRVIRRDDQAQLAIRRDHGGGADDAPDERNARLDRAHRPPRILFEVRSVERAGSGRVLGNPQGRETTSAQGGHPRCTPTLPADRHRHTAHDTIARDAEPRRQRARHRIDFRSPRADQGRPESRHRNLRMLDEDGPTLRRPQRLRRGPHDVPAGTGRREHRLLRGARRAGRRQECADRPQWEPDARRPPTRRRTPGPNHVSHALASTESDGGTDVACRTSAIRHCREDTHAVGVSRHPNSARRIRTSRPT